MDRKSDGVLGFMYRATAAGALAWVVAAVTGPPTAAAQVAANAECDVLPSEVGSVWRADGAPPEYCRAPASSFQLFGAGDFAGTGMRLADPNLFALTTNTGIMDTGNFSTIACCTLPMATRGTESAPSGINYQYFEAQFFEAVARGDWVRNRELAPSLQSVQGGGWTFIANLGRMSSIHMFEGADGSAGLLHSGVISAAGAGCRDHGGNFINYPQGFPLLAGSDCPETWGALGWRGRRPINYEEGWLAEFQEKGDDFAFEFWRVNPDNLIPEEERRFVGDFQTYGSMSDHGRDHRARYGQVIPDQTGDPQIQGYSPGLVWEFNAFSWKIPTISGMFIYEALLINKSEELYDVPLDYDSLYVGIEPRWLRAGSGGSGRRAAVHAIPELGAIVSNELGRTPGCDGGDPVPTSVGCNTGNTRGFRAGASGFVFLKTPIGDLRFKHFSDPTSPFYSPSNPRVGDTITFNRFSLCGFECTNAQFSTLSMRRGWGTIAADVAAALDGRDPNLLSIREYWMLFKPETGSDTRVDLANPRGPGGFNWYVPGDWTYTNRPPGAGLGPDTLFFDTCSPTTNACTALWSDTLPDHTLNWAFNASWLGVGPFPLAAGDTAAFVVAAFAAPDSARFMSQLQNIYNFYLLDFYLGPGVPTPPNIVSVITTGGSRGRGETSISLVLDDAASAWRDPFALKFIEKVEAAVAGDGTDLGRLKALNPNLVELLRDSVDKSNVDRVLVLKSCNGGETFTATAAGDRCPADRAVTDTGAVAGTGWEAYAVLRPDVQGRFPTTFRDASVTAGRAYLYTLVAQTDGIEVIVDDSVDVDGDNVFDRVERVSLPVLPPSSSVLTTDVSAPQAASVYVPASTQAGSQAARAEFTFERGPLARSTGLVDVEISGEVEARTSYRLVFGDSVRVTEHLSATGALDSTVTLVFRSARTGFDAGGNPIFTPFAQDRFVDTTDVSALIAAGAGEVTEVTAPDSRTRTVGVLAGVVALQGGAPVFVSTSLSGDAFTPGRLFSHPYFGGFVVSASNAPGSKLTEFWALDGEELRSASWPSIGWVDASATSTGAQFGRLELTWGGPAFASLVSVDLQDPTRTAQEYAASVTNRASVSGTVTDATSQQLVADALGVPVDQVTLADVALPFVITNRSVGGSGRAVRVAIRDSDLISQVLLGSGVDTVTVPVPAETWIPGVRMFLIEDVDVAETDPDVVVGPDGEPVLTTEPRVTWLSAVAGCGDRATCNPVTGPGQTGHVSVRAGMSLVAEYANPITAESVYDFDVIPAVVGNDVTSIGSGGLRDVRVVPNPYIVFSAYEQESGQRRLMFTHLPPQGRISIFTAAGQFVQRIAWEPGDLSGNGDLFWNLRTREDTEIAAGLYVYVVEATGPAGGGARKLGKFIIIR